MSTRANAKRDSLEHTAGPTSTTATTPMGRLFATKTTPCAASTASILSHATAFQALAEPIVTTTQETLALGATGNRGRPAPERVESAPGREADRASHFILN
jgi:hypothetical protein